MVRPFESVLALLVDGARPDVMRRLAAAGEMPVFKAHFIDAGGFRQAVGVFPSVSGPAHLPMFSGVHPGRANLPGIRWAERPTKDGFWRRTRSYMAPGHARKLQRDIPPEIKTLFHHVDDMVDVNTWFVRGCPPHHRRGRGRRVGAMFASVVTKNWFRGDDQSEHEVVRAIDAGFPSVSAVFPSVDEVGHRVGPEADLSYEGYRRLDAALGRIFDALARRGRADRTLVVVTSDHGQTATHTHIDLPALVAETYPKTLSYPLLWRNLFSAEAAVMVSGNALANVYVRGESGWASRPDFEATGSRAHELVSRLLAHPGIELLIHRQGEHGYVVRGARGRMVIKADDRECEGARFEPSFVLELSVDGENPLGYGGVPSTVTREHLAELTADTGFPDAPGQIVDFFRAQRAGDIVVCARPGWDLRAKFEYQPHKGSHGCLNREHILVVAAANAAWGAPRVRAIDLFPSVLAALDKKVPPGLDGAPVSLTR